MILIFLVFNFFLLALSQPSEQWFTLRSSRKIPRSVIGEYFPTLTDSQIQSKFYEISADFNLVGQGLNLNLYNVTSASVHRVMNVRDGGKATSVHTVQDGRQDNAFIRKGRDFQVGHSYDGTVLGVWGPGIVLQPLELQSYPGLYVNILTEPTSNFPAINDIKSSDEIYPIGNHGQNSRSQDRNIDSSSRQTSKCVPGVTTKQVNIAAAFDHRLCKRYGSLQATQQAISIAVEIANEPFVRQTCVTLRISVFDGYCSANNDPYRDYERLYATTKEEKQNMIWAFRDFWNENRTNIDRDVAYFFPSFTREFNPIGTAYYQGICSRDYGYGWAEGPYPILIAHELGHSFNAVHEDTGIMEAFMNISQRTFSFATSAVQSIINYASSESASCLKPPVQIVSSPNPSPTSVPSKNPIPSPVSPTSSPSRTCGDVMAPSLGFQCKNAKFPGFVFQRSGARIFTKVNIKRDIISVKLFLQGKRAGTKFKYRSAIVHATLNRNIQNAKQLKQIVGGATMFSSNISVVRKSFVASKVSLDGRDINSCCSKILKVYVFVDIEQYIPKGVSWNGQEMRVFRIRLDCKRCNSNNLLPMTKGRACPRCI